MGKKVQVHLYVYVAVHKYFEGFAVMSYENEVIILICIYFVFCYSPFV